MSTANPEFKTPENKAFLGYLGCGGMLLFGGLILVSGQWVLGGALLGGSYLVKKYYADRFNKIAKDKFQDV